MTRRKRRTPNARRRTSKAECRHLRVNIRAIDRAYSERTRSRTVSGQCQDCMQKVAREVTAVEIASGQMQTEWRLAA